MRAVPLRRPPTFAIALAALALALMVPAAGGAGKAVPGCPSFSSQAEAQELFVELGGSGSRNASGLDGDGDGVACEGLSGPYAGFATIGYHRVRGFFYGAASMPATTEGFACMSGNRSFPEGPRRLRVYRVRPGPDLAVSRLLRAEALEASGRLRWKLEKALVPGRYYAAFEERQPEGPYRPPECPGFSSAQVLLPQPRR